MVKVLIALLKRLWMTEPKSDIMLGRWKREKCELLLNKKVELTNVDNCGYSRYVKLMYVKR